MATSAGTNGQLVTDITATLSKSPDDFTSISATNVIVENGIRTPDGTWQTSPTGPFVRNPALVDPETKALIDKYRVAVAPIANRIVGLDLRRHHPHGDNDRQPGERARRRDRGRPARLHGQSAGAQIAFMNPGGIRTDLIYGDSAGRRGARAR